MLVGAAWLVGAPSRGVASRQRCSQKGVRKGFRKGVRKGVRDGVREENLSEVYTVSTTVRVYIIYIKYKNPQIQEIQSLQNLEFTIYIYNFL